MPIDKQQSNQFVNEAKLPVLRTAARQELDDILAKVNEEFKEPLRLFASDPFDAKLNIAPNQNDSADGTKRVLLSANDSIGSYVATTIDFQTAAIVGGSVLTNNAAFALPTTTIGEFRRMALVYVPTSNVVDTAFSAAAASVGALADPVTLFAALDGIPLGYIDLEATAANAFKTAGSATAIIENSVGGNSRIFKGAASGSGSGSGSLTDFKLQSIGSNIATIKKGSLFLDDGRELYSNADIQFNLKTEVNEFGVTAPGASTQYHLYLDLSYLPSQTSVGNSDRKVYVPADGTTGMFVVLTTKPEDTDLARYVPLASLKTNGSSDYTLFDNLALRRHQRPSVNVSPLVQTVGPLTIGALGAANNIAHLKDIDSYPPGVGSSTLSLLALAADPNDSIGARNFTNVGTTPFTGTDIMGNLNSAAHLNGTTQSFTYAVDNYFNVGDADFTADIWAAADDWTPSATQCIFGAWPSNSDRGWRLDLTATGSFNFNYATAPTTNNSLEIANPGFVDGSWHHFSIRYVASTNTWTVYIDGAPYLSVSQVNLVTAANHFALGSRNTISADWFDGRLCQFGFVKQALNDTEIAKLAAAKIDVTASVSRTHQIWEADYVTASGLRSKLENWMLDKRDTKLYASFGNVAADSVELRLYDGHMGVTTSPVRAFNRMYISDPFIAGELAHGLPSMPTNIALLFDEGADGKYRNIAQDVGVSGDNTKLYADLSSYTIDATHRLWVVASIGSATIGFEYPAPDQQSPSGTLAAGQVDISAGPFRVARYGGSQHGEKLLYIDGLLMKRNVGNATASPSADGNYEEVDAGDGIGTIFRMNDTSGSAREYSIVANGVPFHTPVESLASTLQNLGGQIDNIVAALVTLDFDADDLQAAPNDVDLAAFGARVLGLEETSGIPKFATVSAEGAVKKNKFQTKILAAAVTTAINVTGLTFNNLVIGRKYRLSGHVFTRANAGGDISVYFYNHTDGTSNLVGSVRRGNDGAVVGNISIGYGVNYVFTAVHATLETRVQDSSGTFELAGDNSKFGTFLTLEEINNYDETTDFT